MVTFIVLNPDNRSGIVTGPWSDPEWVPPGGLLITTNQLIQLPNTSSSFQRTGTIATGMRSTTRRVASGMRGQLGAGAPHLAASLPPSLSGPKAVVTNRDPWALVCCVSRTASMSARLLKGVEFGVKKWWLSGSMNAGQRASMPSSLKGHEPRPWVKDWDKLKFLIVDWVQGVVRKSQPEL